MRQMTLMGRLGWAVVTRVHPVWAVVLLMVCAGLALSVMQGGCAQRRSAGAPKPTVSLKGQADQVEKSTGVIRREAAAAVDLAPVVKPHTDAIGDEADALDVVSRQLREAQRERDDLAAAHDRAIKERDAARKEAAEAKDAGTKTLRRWLAVMAAASVLGAVLCGWFLRSFTLAAGCVVLFAACIAASWILAYATWIALGVGAALAIGGGWALITKHITLAQVVKTVDKLPIDHAALKSVGEAVQSQATEARVKAARATAGLLERFAAAWGWIKGLFSKRKAAA